MKNINIVPNQLIAKISDLKVLLLPLLLTGCLLEAPKKSEIEPKTIRETISFIINTENAGASALLKDISEITGNNKDFKIKTLGFADRGYKLNQMISSEGKWIVLKDFKDPYGPDQYEVAALRFHNPNLKIDPEMQIVYVIAGLSDSEVEKIVQTKLSDPNRFYEVEPLKYTDKTNSVITVPGSIILAVKLKKFDSLQEMKNYPIQEQTYRDREAKTDNN